MGEAYLLCLLNKYFKFLIIGLALVSFNSFSFIMFVSVLVTMSVNMCAIMCTNFYENLVLNDDIKIGQTTSHSSELRSFRLRKRFYVSLLPQQLIYVIFNFSTK